MRAIVGKAATRSAAEMAVAEPVAVVARFGAVSGPASGQEPVLEACSVWVNPVAR